MTAIHVKGVCTRADPFTGNQVSADFANTETHKAITLLMPEGLAESLGVAMGLEIDVTLEATQLKRNASAFQVTGQVVPS